ncbi:MAG: hypothetical protein N4A31_04905 [Rickettsiales bacterium]|jgi:hypothetical protein|nr:hypothetical protein [Rickettsiales bacterium]
MSNNKIQDKNLIEAPNEKIKSLNKQVKDLGIQVTTLIEETSNLETQVKTCTAEKGNYDAEVLALNAQVTTIQEEQTKLLKTIDDMNKYIVSIPSSDEELLSYSNDALEENNSCQNNGWLSDNIFCPISNKMNEFWEPLPTWGKVSVVTIAITGAILTTYFLLPTSAQRFSEESAQTYREGIEARAGEEKVAQAVRKAYANLVKESLTERWPEHPDFVEGSISAFNKLSESAPVSQIDELYGEFIGDIGANLD